MDYKHCYKEYCFNKEIKNQKRFNHKISIAINLYIKKNK